MATALVNDVFSRYGCPEHLLSDRGPNFTSALLRAVTDIMGVKRPLHDGEGDGFNAVRQSE